jgi:hypothetical protein
MTRMNRFAHETPAFAILCPERIFPANYSNLRRINMCRARRAKSKRGVRQLPDTASIEVTWLILYRGGPPNLTVTSLEQFEVPASHTL